MHTGIRVLAMAAFFVLGVDHARAAPPFVCSIHTDWELQTRTDLTEEAKAARRTVTALFSDANAGTGPTLDLVFSEVAKAYPEAKWAYSEMSAEITRIDFVGYGDTPCFRMSDEGLKFIVTLFKR